MNHYEDKNHRLVSEKIKNINNIHWIVSYDNVPEIKELYSDCEKKEYSFKHTAYSARIGKEILFFSPGLLKSNLNNRNPVNYKLHKKGTGPVIIYKEPKDKNSKYISVVSNKD